MSKIFRKLAFSLLVIFSLTIFIGCGNKGSGNNNSDSTGGDDQVSTPAYVIDNSESDDIISDTVMLLDDNLVQINNLNVFEGIDLAEPLAVANLFDEAGKLYYYNSKISALETDLELDKVYMLSNSSVSKFFKKTASSTNDKLNVVIMYDTSDITSYYEYDIKVNEGNIQTISFKFIYNCDVNIKSHSFGEIYLDLVNKKLEVLGGKPITSKTGREFFEGITEQSFGSWGVTYNFKFDFNDLASIKLNNIYSPNAPYTDFVSDLMDFDFASCYSVYDSFYLTDNTITDIQIFNFDENRAITFDDEELKFVIRTNI